MGVVGAASVGFAGACEGPRSAQSREEPAIPPGATDSREYGLSLPHFAPLIGSAFQFAGLGSGTATAASLKLSGAQDLGIEGRAPVSRAECFSLAFSTGDGDRLVQGTYAVSHDVLGSFSLFIVPGSSGGGEGTYTALVNRL
jgi:hypothetical protein